MEQKAPDPQELFDLVGACRYRPGWEVAVEDRVRDRDADGAVLSEGLTLVITTQGYNAYHPEHGENYRVHHYFAVPPATYDRRSWRRRLFERFADVDRHEATEFFAIGDEHPYAPSHAPGNDPYLLRELGTVEDQRTSFRGTLNP
jgi:hypothetical protein